MDIFTLKNNLENDFKDLKIEIENQNEIYLYSNSFSFRQILLQLKNEYRYTFAAEFCTQERSDQFRIYILLTHRFRGFFIFISYETNQELISIQDIVFQSNLFEREIRDLYGLTIIGGKDIRSLVKHETWPRIVHPLTKEFQFGTRIIPASADDCIEDYEFKLVDGDQGYQIPVGPVHAGIIEPGHFRFSVVGEPIDNLEIRLMYKHRGIEKIAENTHPEELNLLFERVAGESSVAYSESYALLIEKLLAWKVPIEVQRIRVILLELERIYNYLDDIAGICIDVAFSYPSKKYGFFSELIHQLSELITGNRFMRNSIVPGGIGIKISQDTLKRDILTTFKKMIPRFNRMVKMTLDASSFLDRTEETGIVSSQDAIKYHLTGVIGRACGIPYDVRIEYPYEIYPNVKTKAICESIGGVHERYLLKIAEIRDSIRIITEILPLLTGDIQPNRPEIVLPTNKKATVAVETVKGELIIFGETGSNNRFNRIFFKTPSFTNWDGLTEAVLGEIVPDFPLCNKSFNCSYSENDR